MRQALIQAQKAFEEDEVPIGAVVVINNKIIARGYNQVERLNDPTAHAEMIALTSAFNYLGSKYLPDATLYVTIEPCLMCAGAMYWSKIGRIVYVIRVRRGRNRAGPRGLLRAAVQDIGPVLGIGAGSAQRADNEAVECCEAPNVREGEV